ncbi:MAG: ribosome biogenesis GTPase Der [bacterium]
MSKPVVAIVGRPNVGKSTLFNRLIGYAKAIVKDVHGVTRDRNYSDMVWEDRVLTLVDTGGFFPETEEMLSLIRKQALYAIEEADLIIHLLDGKEGFNPLDLELATIIRASGKKTLWVVNKIDDHRKTDRILDFYEIGAADLMPVSAESGYGIDELMEKVLTLLPETPVREEPEYPRIAIVGKPNVGKSTIVNTLLGKERMIVSPVAGTTRDSVDSVCRYYGKKYILIDTAGIRKKSKIDASLEEASVQKAIGSIERADVVVLLLDATAGITDQDQSIAGLALRREKGLVLLFNKWDLVHEPEARYRQIMSEIGTKLWFARFAPVLTVSALSKRRVSKLFPAVDTVIGEMSKRISTAELNKMRDEIESVLPSYRGRKIKLYYATQVGVRPPSFAFFVNHPEGVKEQHIRRIENSLRGRYSFEGTPLNIFIRKRE